MFHIIIPARYASSRLPGKPLLKIGDLPMIAHVYQRAIDAGAASICVATDDERIADIIREQGGNVFFSKYPHESGTSRLAECVSQMNYNDNDIIVNLQGDEPFIPASLLQQAANVLASATNAAVSTLYTLINEVDKVFDPNVVKVVLNAKREALYFSRAPMPWLRDQFAQQTRPEKIDTGIFYRHIGIYAYRVNFLKQYINLSVSPLEQYENLEQLRVLWHGYTIALAEALANPGHEVNTPDDLVKAQILWENTRNT